MMKFSSKITAEYADPEAWGKAYREKRAWESLIEVRDIARLSIAEAAMHTQTRATLIMAMEAGDVVPAYDMYEAYITKLKKIVAKSIRRVHYKSYTNGAERRRR